MRQLLVFFVWFWFGVSHSTLFGGEALRGIPLSAKVFDSKQVPFIGHEGPGDFDTWLAVNVPWEPVERLRKTIEKETGGPLQHRGEAHITLLTPVEWQALRKVLSIGELHRLFKKNIQSVPYQVTCLGKFSKEMEGKAQTTYFLVVQSQKLFEMREAIAKAFVKKGGEVKAFDPLEYFPHITVGFTQKDFHQSDGALKDFRACEKPVQITKR